MLTRISILTNKWQQINLTGSFRNNVNTQLLINRTESSSIEPSSNVGIIIKAYESFQIPDDGLQYWARYINGSGELIVDPTVKFATSSLPGSGDISVFDFGDDVFAGASSSREITLNVSADGDNYQIIITPNCNVEDSLLIGSISVEYDGDTFTVYNTGSAGINFKWSALWN